MTLPSYILGTLYALLIGSLFHVWRGGGAARLLFYLLLSLLGGAAGQWLGTWQEWSLFPVGPLNLGLITIGSLLFLIVGHWLSLADIRGGQRGRREV